MDNPNFKERVCMHLTGIACDCVILTCNLKYVHNFWTACPILEIFSGTWSDNVLPFITENSISIGLKVKEILNSKVLNYAISRKLIVRFKNCFHQQIQRPWFQDKYFIKYRKFFLVKKFVTEWSSYLYAQYIEFFYYKVYWNLGPRPVPTPWGILLKIHTAHCLVIMIISWKFEVNPLRIDGDMTGR